MILNELDLVIIHAALKTVSTDIPVHDEFSRMIKEESAKLLVRVDKEIEKKKRKAQEV